MLLCYTVQLQMTCPIQWQNSPNIRFRHFSVKNPDTEQRIMFLKLWVSKSEGQCLDKIDKCWEQD